MIQFALPVLGLGAPLVKQWWIPGFLPRVNGFSYEPSYLATYLLIGFVFASSLRRARSALLSSKSLLSDLHADSDRHCSFVQPNRNLFLVAEAFLHSWKKWPSFVADLMRLRISRRKVRQLAPYLSMSLLAMASVSTVFLLADGEHSGHIANIPQRHRLV